MKNQITFILCLFLCTAISAQSGDSMAGLMTEGSDDIVAFASSKKTPTATARKKPKTKDEKDAKKLDYQTKIQRTFSVYPSPAHHWVVINTENLGIGNFSYIIKNSFGKVIETETMTQNSKTINLKEFEKGVYFITLKENDGNIKWVKKVTVI